MSQTIKYAVRSDTTRDLERKIVAPDDLKKTRVVFKSLPKYYDLEESGLKPNTHRFKSVDDPRVRILLSMKLNGAYGQIRVTNSENNKLSFVRRIKSVTEFNKTIVISWWPTYDNIVDYLIQKFTKGGIHR